MEDKKIRLSVDDQKLKDLRRSTKELADDMIRQSRNYTTSSKEILRDLEQQIKLIEKRNRLEKERQEVFLRQQLSSGAITQSQFKTNVNNIRSESSMDKLQVGLLREIIETIKQASKNEIKEDREAVSRSIRKSKTVNSLGVGRHQTPERSLIEVLQRDELGDLGEEEQLGNQKFRDYGKFGKTSNFINRGSQVATSKNAFYAASAILAFTPFVGQALGNLSNRFLSSAEQAGKAKEKFASSYRMSMNGYTDNKGKYHSGVNDIHLIKNFRQVGTGFGFTGSETLNRKLDYEAIAKHKVNISSLLGAERNLKLTQGDISSIFGSTRHHTSSGDASTAISNLNNVIKVMGKRQDELPEILKTFNQIANTISQHSFVDIDKLSRTIGGISEKSGLTGQHLSNFTNQIQGLSGGGSNPVIRSMMINAFRKANPNKSFWDISTMMENPMGHAKEMSSMFRELENKSGNGDMMKWVLKSALPGATNQDIDTYLKSGASISEILASKSKKTNIGIETDSRGSNKVSEMTNSTAKFSAFFEDFGDKAVVFTDKLFKKLDSKMNSLFDEENEESDIAAKNNARLMREAVAQGIKDGLKKH